MKRATIVVDYGFGDAGKGSMVDFLVRQRNATMVVRYNGGAQAAHNVVLPDGRSHTFAQFGSGTLAGVPTHLSKYMVIDPLSMRNEAKHLAQIGCGDPYRLLTVDERAIVVSPFQRTANRLREILRGDDRHGTCGMGIGEAVVDSQAILASETTIRAGDLQNRSVLRRKLNGQQEMKYEEFRHYRHILCHHVESDIEQVNLINRDWVDIWGDEMHKASTKIHLVDGDYLDKLHDGEIIFEGAQGVLLDQTYGFHPYSTWSHTGSENAYKLLDALKSPPTTEEICMLRAYHVRHGAGPLPTEDLALKHMFKEKHNKDGGWQGEFRFGWFDVMLATYALSVGAHTHTIPLQELDQRVLAITCLDHISRLPYAQICTSYNKWAGNHQLTPAGFGVPSTDLAEDAPQRQREQEWLTRELFKVEPVYTEVKRDTDAYLNELQSWLTLPIRYASYGPTHEHKREG